MQRKVMIFLIIVFLPFYMALESEKAHPANEVFQLSDSSKDAGFIDIAENDRLAIYDVVKEFLANQYNFSPDNYIQQVENLVPLLTEEYQKEFVQTAKNTISPVKESEWNSQLVNFKVNKIVGKNISDAYVVFEFQTELQVKGQDSRNSYISMMELEKQDGVWLINHIDDELPVTM